MEDSYGCLVESQLLAASTAQADSKEGESVKPEVQDEITQGLLTYPKMFCPQVSTRRSEIKNPLPMNEAALSFSVRTIRWAWCGVSGANSPFKINNSSALATGDDWKNTRKFLKLPNVRRIVVVDAPRGQKSLSRWTKLHKSQLFSSTFRLLLSFTDIRTAIDYAIPRGFEFRICDNSSGIE